MPVDHGLIAAWLMDKAEAGASVSTVSACIAAVRWAHKQAGHPFERSPLLDNALDNIRRDFTRAQDQAAPLKAAMLVDMLLTAPATLQGRRDSAMLALLYVFALRRSELVDTHYGPTPGHNALVITPDALVLTFHRSKTAQDRLETVTTSRADNMRAVGAVERWVREAGIEPGTPLIRSLSPRGTVQPEPLSGPGICQAVRRCVREYFIATGMAEDLATSEAAKYSGHSGRVGFITTAIEAGATHEAVARVSRHRSGSRMIERYSEQADQLRTSPHKLPGVGI